MRSLFLCFIFFSVIGAPLKFKVQDQSDLGIRMDFREKNYRDFVKSMSYENQLRFYIKQVNLKNELIQEKFRALREAFVKGETQEKKRALIWDVRDTVDNYINFLVQYSLTNPIYRRIKFDYKRVELLRRVESKVESIRKSAEFYRDEIKKYEEELIRGFTGVKDEFKEVIRVSTCRNFRLRIVTFLYKLNNIHGEVLRYLRLEKENSSSNSLKLSLMRYISGKRISDNVTKEIQQGEIFCKKSEFKLKPHDIKVHLETSKFFDEHKKHSKLFYSYYKKLCSRVKSEKLKRGCDLGFTNDQFLYSLENEKKMLEVLNEK